MKILFLHQNFPGQYKNLVAELVRQGGHDIVFLTQHANADAPGVRKIVYKPSRKATEGVHRYIGELESAVLNGQAVAQECEGLRSKGFRPDIIVGHNGWGETLYVKDVWPSVPLLAYFEFYYKSSGSDVGFENPERSSLDNAARLRTRNTINLLGLEAADAGQCPTRWQFEQFPASGRHKLSIVHEGIDTSFVRPDPNARIDMVDRGVVLTRRDEVVTYVARNLEPYRGFHKFMRALPEIQRRRPNAHVVIVGGDGVSYGSRLPEGQSYRKNLTEELGSSVDFSRVHFFGHLPYAKFLRLLQVSSAHVYLTYPFVLSWSMLEAMAAGCLVVGSSTPPVVEVLKDGKNGLLADFFSPAGIAKRIDEVLSHPDRMQAIREEARATILRDFDLKTVCLPKMLSVMGTLAGGHGTPLQQALPAQRLGVAPS